MGDVMAYILPSPLEMREESLRKACEEQQQVGDDSSRGVCGFMEAGVEAGFAARVLHTTVDAFGSLSVVRIITNDYDIDDASSKKKFKSLPNEVVVLRSG